MDLHRFDALHNSQTIDVIITIRKHIPPIVNLACVSLETITTLKENTSMCSYTCVCEVSMYKFNMYSITLHLLLLSSNKLLGQYALCCIQQYNDT